MDDAPDVGHELQTRFGGYKQLQWRQQQRWHSDSKQGRSSNALMPSSLPGIATFFQFSESLPQHRSLQRATSMNSVLSFSGPSPERMPFTTSKDSQRDDSEVIQTLALGRSRQLIPRSSSLGDSDTSSSSPHLRGALKKCIASSTAPSRHRSFGRTNTGGSDSSGSGRAATKLHTSYKPRGNPATSSMAQNRSVLRTTRYLSEYDRRNILRRIGSGEKQADLAKEYQVSRAAVSNMKQRRNRKERNRDALNGQHEELAIDNEQYKHNHMEQHDLKPPERMPESNQIYSHPVNDDSQLRVLSPLSVGSYHSSESEDLKDRDSRPPSTAQVRGLQQQQMEKERAIQMDTPTLQILVTRLIDEQADPRTAQVAKMRIARLLLEQALASFPTRAVEISVTRSSSSSPYYVGTEFLKPVCAIALVQLPQHVYESNVLILADSLRSFSTQELVRAVQALLFAGVAERAVCVVTMCSHERTLVHLLEAFPHVRVLTVKLPLAHGALACIDEVVDRIHSRLLPSR